jgi:hypothetical protein
MEINMTRHDMVQQVRELLERHVDLADIAARLNLDVVVVQNLADSLTNILHNIG